MKSILQTEPNNENMKREKEDDCLVCLINASVIRHNVQYWKDNGLLFNELYIVPFNLLKSLVSLHKAIPLSMETSVFGHQWQHPAGSHFLTQKNIHGYATLYTYTHVVLTCVASSSTVFFSRLTSSRSGPSVSMSIGLSEPPESIYIRNCTGRREEEGLKMWCIFSSVYSFTPSQGFYMFQQVKFQTFYNHYDCNLRPISCPCWQKTYQGKSGVPELLAK